MSVSLTRRSFNAGLSAVTLSSLAGAGLITALAPDAALAQGKPEYTLLKPPMNPDVEKGKIEVIEFFWYGCPHCNGLEPVLREWHKKLPSDVVFKKVHVPFREEKHQQLFYALESLGKVDALTEKVFFAMHVENNPLDSIKSMSAWAAKQGIDAKLMEQTLESFGVKAKMKKASMLTTASGLTGVPALVVNGKYLTAPSMVGSNSAVLRVVDQLIDQERKARK